MDGEALGFVDGVRDCFAELTDPRIQKSCEHLLFDILAIAVLAVACGANDWCGIATFARLREEWLRTFLKLPGGIPAHDTFRRVFGLLDRRQFAACLFQWTRALQEASGGKLISIDGKTLRRTGSRKQELKPLHLVTAWASENGLTLGLVPCEEKSNEITAIPELLRLLNLKGCTVTIDAMGCQWEIADQIREQGGHYVLGVKDNQPTLHDDLRGFFEQALNEDFQDVQHQEYTATETAHGRTTTRTYHALELPQDHRQRGKWRDLRTVIFVTTRVKRDEQETWESRCYISDLAPRARSLGTAIRQHWGIENGQHWVLDVAFQEDTARQRDRRGAVNLASVRRLVLSLLRQDKQLRLGAVTKRMACALDPRYLLQVFSNPKIDA